MIINKVTEKKFREYGRVLEGYNLEEICQAMKETPMPSDVVYEPSINELETLSIARELQERAFGGMDIQIGYCNGNNKILNAVEYHRCSEINIAITDLILLLGKEEDIAEDYSYDTAKIEAFLIPAGTIIEVYGTTLHYAPCNASKDGFRCVVVLPKGTNEELAFKPKNLGEDALLFAKNKWLIAHEDSGLDKEEAFIGLKGKNISI